MDVDPRTALNARAFPARRDGPKTAARVAASLVEADGHVQMVSFGWFPL